MKIFVVDESPMLCERMVFLMHDLDGVEVVGCAHDPAHAADSIRSTHPDAVLVNMRMQVCRKLMDLLRCSGPAPICIALIAHASPAMRKRWKEAGATFVFDSGTQVEKMMETVAQLVREEKAP